MNQCINMNIERNNHRICHMHNSHCNWGHIPTYSMPLHIQPTIQRLPAVQVLQPQKRFRTTYTPNQVSVLEQEFSRLQYPSTKTINCIANKLNLSSQKVRTWFKNRRSKYKKLLTVAVPLSSPDTEASTDSLLLEPTEPLSQRTNFSGLFQPSINTNLENQIQIFPTTAEMQYSTTIGSKQDTITDNQHVSKSAHDTSAMQDFFPICDIQNWLEHILQDQSLAEFSQYGNDINKQFAAYVDQPFEYTESYPDTGIFDIQDQRLAEFSQYGNDINKQFASYVDQPFEYNESYPDTGIFGQHVENEILPIMEHHKPVAVFPVIHDDEQSVTNTYVSL